MNILFLAREIPYPADSGVKMRAWLVLKQLASRHRITLICYAGSQEPRAPELKQICESLVVIDTPSRTSSSKLSPKMLCGLFSEIPFGIRGRFSRVYDATVKDVLKEKKIDLIVCDSLYQALYLPSEKYKTILNEHNIESTIIERYAKIERNIIKRLYAGYECRRMKAFENKIWKQCDLIFACSQVDKAEIERRSGVKHVEVVPNGVNVPELKNKEEMPFDLIYTGLIGWRPNEDAVLYFAREIYPLIKKHLPQVRFWIVGKGPSPAVKALEREGTIHVTGAVAHVEPYIEKGGVVVVPLRIGSGTRLKILEAFVFKKAVVSTAIGCEGLEVTHGKDIMIADEPLEFAGAVIQLLEDEMSRKRLGENGRRLVEEKYSYEVIGRTIEGLVEKI